MSIVYVDFVNKEVAKNISAKLLEDMWKVKDTAKLSKDILEIQKAKKEIMNGWYRI
jgi:hypothetical protein